MAKKVKVSSFGSANNAPSPPSGRLMLLILAAVVLLIVGFVAGKQMAGTKSQSVSTPRTKAVGESSSEYGPTKKVGIAPAGFQKSTEGAVAAASSYVSVLPQMYLLKDDPLITSLAQISTPEFITELRDRINKTRVSAQSIFDEDPNAYYREFPLGYTVISSEDDKASIQLWSIVMLAAQPEYNGNTQSTIHTIDLEWTDGDWKISDWTTTAGPTPRWQSPTEPGTVEEFLNAIKPFDRGYSYVPSL